MLRFFAPAVLISAFLRDCFVTRRPVACYFAVAGGSATQCTVSTAVQEYRSIGRILANVVAEEPLAIVAVDDEHREAKSPNLGGFVKRIASILTGLSLAVLFFGASAHAQSEQRVSGNIPFDFTVGSLSLPAGQYEFRGVGNNIIQLRDSDGRSVFALSSAPVEAEGLPEKATLKFAVVNGHHVLIQIRNDLAGNGNEFPYGNASLEAARQRTIEGTVAEHR